VPSGDDHDFAGFYAGVFPRLVGQLFLITRNLQDAEDVVQEAMARASARWARVRDYDVPEAWVRRVAVRLAADLARRGRRRLAATARLASMRSMEAVEPPTDDLQLVEALGALSLSQRQVLVLHHLVGLPVAEVAITLRIPVGTVKSRLKCARRTLAVRLAEGNQEGVTSHAHSG
jgi:RNA polymerase sigma-70 factor (ECF subfamily)